MSTKHIRMRTGLKEPLIGGGAYLANEEVQAPAKAIALGYEPGKDNAPRVLATGKGKIAEHIIALAKENNIPIREDPVLASALANLEIDMEIPPELYAVIAEVFAYVYRIQKRTLGSRV
jgi:flagellar biosynthesis protein